MARQLQFDHLPIELQLNIFSYFSQKELSTCIALVCRSWRHIANDSALWKQVQIPYKKSPHQDVSAYCILLHQHPLILELELVLDYTTIDLIQIIPFLPILKIFKLSTVCVNLDIDHVVTQCPAITELYLEAPVHLHMLASVLSMRNLCNLSIFSISDKRTWVPANDVYCIIAEKSCGGLKKLQINLERGNYLTGEAILIKLIEKHGHTLTHFALNVQYISDSVLQQINRCLHLEALNIRYLYLSADYPTLASLSKLTFLSLSAESLDKSVFVIDKLILTTPHLTHISLHCMEVSEKLLKNISKSCKFLEILQLIGCIKIDHTFYPLLKCVHLKHLSISNLKITETVITKMLDSLPNLLSLGAWAYDDISIVNKYAPHLKYRSVTPFQTWFDRKFT